MKVIQTFWSFPNISYSPETSESRFRGGWVSEKLHAISWAFSCLKLTKHYKGISLYTDAHGAEWLIDRLKLPYKDLHIELDILSPYPSSLWALPKVYVYGKQSEPFIHVDGDVYIWKKFKEKFIESKVFVQNFEYNHPQYRKIIKDINDAMFELPDFLSNEYINANGICSINAGVIGGTDNDFFKYYAEIVFTFVHSNLNKIITLNSGLLNLVFEQLFLYHYALQNKIKISSLFKSMNNDYSEVLGINLAPMMKSYIHLVGDSKQNHLICLELEARLKYEFPKMHNHLKSLYPDFHSTVVIDPKLKFFEYPLTRDIIKRLQPNLVNAGNDEIELLVNDLFENEKDLSDDEYLLVSVFQLEKGFTSLTNSKKTINEDYLGKMIFETLNIIYNCTRNKFLDNHFELNVEICQVLCLRFKPTPIINESTLREFYIHTDTIFFLDTYSLYLIESVLGEIRCHELEGWDKLLYCFDQNRLTGNEILKLITDGDTPFQFDESDIMDQVLNFLINNALLHRRLKITS